MKLALLAYIHICNKYGVPMTFTFKLILKKSRLQIYLKSGVAFHKNKNLKKNN
jgi:hypothetical protein